MRNLLLALSYLPLCTSFSHFVKPFVPRCSDTPTLIMAATILLGTYYELGTELINSKTLNNLSSVMWQSQARTWVYKILKSMCLNFRHWFLHTQLSSSCYENPIPSCHSLKGIMLKLLSLPSPLTRTFILYSG